MPSKWNLWGWEPWGVAALLGCLFVYWLQVPKPVDAQPYLDRIRQVASQIPMNIGDWSGTDVPIPQAAVTMLSPNVVLSRRFINVASGLQADVLLVQCGDARDMLAHYPPECMVNAGWTLADAKSRDWRLGRLPITGTEYQFVINSLDRNESVVVDDFMLLPDGRIARNMTGIEQIAASVSQRYFGAAQMQILMPSNVPQAQRDQAMLELLQPFAPAMNAILRNRP